MKLLTAEPERSEQLQQIIQFANELLADHVGIISAAKIPFEETLRSSCVQNYCGHYNTSWMGPPAVGEISELKQSVQCFRDGIVIQTVDQLEDSFDFEGMLAAKDRHQKIFRSVWSTTRKQLPQLLLLALDVGCCRFCGTCSYPDDPCSNPSEALASVEAYGINVNGLLTECGLKYNNGKDTVSYVGLILIS